MADSFDEFDEIVRRIEGGEGRLVTPPAWAIPSWPPSVVMNDEHADSSPGRSDSMADDYTQAFNRRANGFFGMEPSARGSLKTMLPDSLLEMVERIQAGEREVASLPGRFVLVRTSTFMAIVCSDLDDVAEISRRLELVYPAGVSGGWHLALNLVPDGSVQCDTHSESRHYVFEA